MTTVKLIQNLDDCLDFVDHGFLRREVRKLHSQANGSVMTFADLFSDRNDLYVAEKGRFLVSIIDIDQIDEGYSLLTLFDLDEVTSKVVICNRNCGRPK